MRIDPCAYCGHLIDIASDHDVNCRSRKPDSPIIGRAIYAGVLFADRPDWPTTCKLLFHEDGTITWQKLWNQ